MHAQREKKSAGDAKLIKVVGSKGLIKGDRFTPYLYTLKYGSEANLDPFDLNPRLWGQKYLELVRVHVCSGLPIRRED